MRSAVLAFTVAAALLTLTPGADTALVLRCTARSGSRAGVGSVLGIGTGVLAWGTASGAGVSALLAADPVAYHVLRVLGAGYLALLGVRSLLAGRRTQPPAADRLTPDGATPDGATPDGATPDGASGWSGYRSGLVTNLLNPKIGVFYAAFLPQFVPSGVPVLPMSVALTCIHVAMGTLWLSGVVLLVDRARDLLGRARVRRRMERLTGAVLVGFALRLALTPS